MAFHAVFSKMQNRKYPFQFQRINASSPLWLDRTAVYLIKGPLNPGLKSMFYFVIPSRLILLMFARMSVIRRSMRCSSCGRPIVSVRSAAIRASMVTTSFVVIANSLRIPRGRGNLSL